MKRLRKSAAPSKLAAYVQNSPLANWDDFRAKPGRYQQLAKHIKQDQRGLCAYCEIDLLPHEGNGTVNDFQVEHFHPKSATSPTINWGLAWPNLLGACLGGETKNTAEPARHAAHSQDLHCGSAKKDQDLTQAILDPLQDIPAFPRLFQYSSATGEMAVDLASCPSHLQSKAHNSIELLNLNSPVLCLFRQQILEELNLQFGRYGDNIALAEQEITQALFALNPSDHWPSFFTCIRWYLGSSAEDLLAQLKFQG